MPPLRLAFLGTFQAVLDGRPITQFKGEKVRALLAYLATEADRPHERSSLASLFWPDMPEGRALRNLSQTLARLRETIQDAQAHPPFLSVARHEVRWDALSAYELDAAEFERLLKGGRAEAASDAESALVKGVALYRGDFLKGFGLSDCPDFEDWLLLKRERYHHLALEALQKLADGRLAAGDYVHAQAYARQQVNLEPWREIAHRQLMRALALGGHRSEALAQYDACKRTLAQDLGIEPEAETVSLSEQIRSGQLDRGADGQGQESKATDPHNLPAQLTPFIGRDEERAQLNHLLRDPERRLVTLTGLGGVGKTRLALAAARDLVGVFDHGVWFVPLAGVSVNADGVSADRRDSHERAQHALAGAIADALGLTLTGQESPSEQLLTYLRSRQLLLVLDNFEHLLGEPEGSAPGPSRGAVSAGFVVTMLRTAPHVNVIVTSRERLDVEGEVTVLLQGMPIPADAAEPEIAAAGCVRLFAERAWRSSARFSVNASNLRDILRICELVEGLPLGIELAASWVQHYSLREITGAIQDNLSFLTSPRPDHLSRHTSLRAVFDYSWRMLPAGERRALAQLSVFRSTFSREAALAVTGARLLTLVALVDKCLLRQAGEGEGRYAIHELVRQFAGEQLEAMASEEPALPYQTLARHSDYIIEHVGARGEGLYGSSSRQTLAMIAAESDNLHQALHWAMSHGRWEVIDRHIIEILRIYHFQMNYGEGLALAQQLIRHAEEHVQRDPLSVPPRLLSKLLAEQAFLLTFRGIPREAITSARAVVLQANRVGDAESELAGYLDWGLQEYYLGNYDSAQTLLDKALTLAHSLTKDSAQGSVGRDSALTRHRALLEAQAMRYLAALHIVQGREDEERAYAHELVQAYRRLNHLWGEARTMAFLGDSYFRVPSYVRARECYEEALRVYGDMGNTYGQSHMHVELSRIALFLGDYVLAKQHGERAVAIIRHSGNARFHAYALANMSEWARRTGDDQAAYDHAQAAVGNIQRAGYPSVHAYCLSRLGDALAGLRRLDAAGEAHQHALNLQRDVGSAALIVLALADVARVALLRGELAQAWGCANEALDLLKTHSLSGAPEPWRIYFDLHRVLSAAGDSRAGDVLRTADALLQAQAAKINDEHQRRSFLQAAHTAQSA